ncbi:MAG: 3-deoxy-manno-octulosonate cytidylyltransferase [Candidatus Aegiribacteria sp.]
MAGTITGHTATLAIVPARFSSTRLPGKPLADVAGVPMILRVLRGVAGSVDMVMAATDDERIRETVEGAGFRAVMTGRADSGTERVFMAWDAVGRPGGIIINVQGDEPLVGPGWLAPLLSVPHGDDRVVTLARRVPAAEAGSPDMVKVAVAENGEALYFSRHPVPHGAEQLLEHVGVYSFTPESLERCVSCGSTRLSRTEDLEQLAWLESGVRMMVVEGDFPGTGVDTPEDLERAVDHFTSLQ